jgi:prefoldin subunit 5
MWDNGKELSVPSQIADPMKAFVGVGELYMVEHDYEAAS